MENGAVGRQRRGVLATHPYATRVPQPHANRKRVAPMRPPSPTTVLHSSLSGPSTTEEDAVEHTVREREGSISTVAALAMGVGMSNPVVDVEQDMRQQQDEKPASAQNMQATEGPGFGGRLAEVAGEVVRAAEEPRKGGRLRKRGRPPGTGKQQQKKRRPCGSLARPLSFSRVGGMGGMNPASHIVEHSQSAHFDLPLSGEIVAVEDEDAGLGEKADGCSRKVTEEEKGVAAEYEGGLDEGELDGENEPTEGNEEVEELREGVWQEAEGKVGGDRRIDRAKSAGRNREEAFEGRWRERSEPEPRVGGRGSSDAALTTVDEPAFRSALLSLSEERQCKDLVELHRFESQFGKWKAQLTNGFSLLLYGYGSKRQLLNHFAKTSLHDASAVVINGALADISIFQVVGTILRAMTAPVAQLGGGSAPEGCFRSVVERMKGVAVEEAECILKSSRRSNIEEMLAAVRRVGVRMYLVVHHIDGPGLRGKEMRAALSSLAACPHIHLVASADALLSPLLWDGRMKEADFCWWPHHVVTGGAYETEAALLAPLLIAPSDDSAARPALIVLRSLTANARDVFHELAVAHLSDQSTANSSGLTFQQLYERCRSKFIVASDVTLRAHIREFSDHSLVRIRKRHDGSSCLQILIPPHILSHLLLDMNQP